MTPVLFLILFANVNAGLIPPLGDVFWVTNLGDYIVTNTGAYIVFNPG